jgi:hypothetical protein
MNRGVGQAFQPAGWPGFRARQTLGRQECRPNWQTGMSALPGGRSWEGGHDGLRLLTSAPTRGKPSRVTPVSRPACVPGRSPAVRASSWKADAGEPCGRGRPRSVKDEEGESPRLGEPPAEVCRLAPRRITRAG